MKYNVLRLPNRMFVFRWQKAENQFCVCVFPERGEKKASEIRREFGEAAWRSYTLQQKDKEKKPKKTKNRNCAI